MIRDINRNRQRRVTDKEVVVTSTNAKTVSTHTFSTVGETKVKARFCAGKHKKLAVLQFVGCVTDSRKDGWKKYRNGYM